MRENEYEALVKLTKRVADDAAAAQEAYPASDLELALRKYLVDQLQRAYDETGISGWFEIAKAPEVHPDGSYVTLVKFTRSIYEDEGIARIGFPGLPLREALLRQFLLELDLAYRDLGISGTFDVLYFRMPRGNGPKDWSPLP